MKVVIFILSNPDLLQDVLRSWEKTGVRGVTIFNSHGLGQIKKAMYHDDAPIFPSLSEVLEQAERTNRTLLSVVQEPQVELLIQATEKVVGSLSQSDVGVLFTLPVDRVVGAYINDQHMSR